MQDRHESRSATLGEDRATKPDLGRDVFLARVAGGRDPAYRLATVMLLDYTAAEDAVHDATVRAWAQYRRVRGDVQSFRTWFLSFVAAEFRRVRGPSPGRREADPACPPTVRRVILRLPAHHPPPHLCTHTTPPTHTTAHPIPPQS